MSEVVVDGPKFERASDRVFVGLGHSERKGLADGFLQALHELRIFTHIDAIPLNKMAGFMTRRANREEAKQRLLIGHSASVTRVPAALQVVAFNAPEPTSLFQLGRSAWALTGESKAIPHEQSAWKVGGAKDLTLAGLELMRSPFTSVRTPLQIALGYSAVDHLVKGAERFPAGRVLVHSTNDSFGFQDRADMQRAAENNVTTVMIPDHWHMSMLLEPKRTIELLTPVIFPERWDGSGRLQ